MGILSACMLVYHVHAWYFWRSEEEFRSPELQSVVSCHVGDRNRVQDFWKSSQSFYHRAISRFSHSWYGSISSPDPSFSVHVLVCLSILHPLTAPAMFRGLFRSWYTIRYGFELNLSTSPYTRITDTYYPPPTSFSLKYPCYNKTKSLSFKTAIFEIQQPYYHPTNLSWKLANVPILF